MKKTLRSYREWIYGLFLSLGWTVRALLRRPEALAAGKRPTIRGILKKCGYCKEFLKIDARVCAFCGAIL